MVQYNSFRENLSSVLRENRTDIPGLDDLLQSGISFVVIGALAVNAYSNRPRNTQDIDVLSNDWEQLVSYIQAKFPGLDIEKTEAVIRFSQDGSEIIDVMIPYHEIFQIAISDTRQIGKYHVPSPEAMVALKFAAIMGEHRSLLQKGQDRVDIATILLLNQVDLEKAKQYTSSLFPQASKIFSAFITKLLEDFS